MDVLIFNTGVVHLEQRDRSAPVFLALHAQLEQVVFCNPLTDPLAVFNRAGVHVSDRADLLLHFFQGEGRLGKGERAKGVDDAAQHLVLLGVVEGAQCGCLLAREGLGAVFGHGELHLPGNRPAPVVKSSLEQVERLRGKGSEEVARHAADGLLQGHKQAALFRHRLDQFVLPGHRAEEGGGVYQGVVVLGVSSQPLE